MSLRAKRSNPKTLVIASLHFVTFAMTNVYLILHHYLAFHSALGTFNLAGMYRIEALHICGMNSGF
ncbi:hypothetical protein FDUTEX481_05970 [Tolypothrix sp. PCC 7601]|nr:hypothetical protein FDUTEX481_05970 [Tolypothrix sp. PCC 7601]